MLLAAGWAGCSAPGHSSSLPPAGMATTYEVLVEGDGATVSAGDTVTVHATGIVKETGKKFWSTKDVSSTY